MLNAFCEGIVLGVRTLVERVGIEGVVRIIALQIVQHDLINNPVRVSYSVIFVLPDKMSRSARPLNCKSDRATRGGYPVAPFEHLCM